MEIKKVLKGGDNKKMVIIPKKSNIEVGDLVAIQKVKEEDLKKALK